MSLFNLLMVDCNTSLVRYGNEEIHGWLIGLLMNDSMNQVIKEKSNQWTNEMKWEPPEDGEMNETRLPPRHRIEIQALAVWGRARYLLVTGDHHNSKSLRVSGEEIFCFFETWKSEWGSNERSPTLQAGTPAAMNQWINEWINNWRIPRIY